MGPEKNIFAPWDLLLGNGYGYNTQNQYQPLLSAKDHCIQNSEGTVIDNQSYHTEIEGGNFKFLTFFLSNFNAVFFSK
jgi:hypothetical protein